jgi:DNA-binding MarR family transcriptional regulator
VSASTPWLTDDEQHAWRSLAAVTMLLPAALENELQREAGLTHFGYWVLAMLSEAPGRAARISELAALSNGSQSQLSYVAARLEQKGWVSRERSTQDGRGHVCSLTPAGYDKLVAAASGHVGAVRELVFAALTAEQVAQLDVICSALLARLASAPG